jgi:peptide/nickel transport system substrate-binding protein
MSLARRARTLAVAAALSALALPLAACGGSSAASGPTGTASSSAQPVDGGALTFAIGNDPISLNPDGTGSGNDTLYVTRQLVDSLLWQDPKDGSLKPWLASSWEANADSTQFTFHLRDGVTFSDGTPFDADAVKANFDDVIAAGAKSTAAPSFVGYTSTTVVDPHTVQVAFAAPNAAFPQATSTVALGFVAKSTLAIPFDQRSSGKGVIGTGPFVLDHYTKDTETVLNARTDYAWGPAGATSHPHLKSVTFQVIPEQGVRTGALTSDQVDAIGGVQPTDIETIQGAGLDLVHRANPGISFGLTFDEARPLGADPAVRQAVALAIDPKVVRDTALSDGFAVAKSPLASTTPGVADESKLIVTDPKKAEQVLQADGWAKGSDGIYAKDGQKLAPVLAWITNFGPNETSVQLIQQQLKAVGIDATLWSGAVPDFIKGLSTGTGQFDLVWGNLSRADGDVLRTQYSVKATNYYHLNDPDLEALLQKQLTISDTKARADVLAQAQARLVTQHHVVPVHELTTYLGLQPKVHGVALGADSRLDQLTGAWVDGK